jgi:hypothetical protein
VFSKCHILFEMCIVVLYNSNSFSSFPCLVSPVNIIHTVCCMLCTFFVCIWYHLAIYHNDIIEILLKVALSTITSPPLSYIHDIVEIILYSSPPVIRPPLLQWKKWPYKRVVSLEGIDLLVFYYLSTSDIWPDKEGWPWVGVAL